MSITIVTHLSPDLGQSYPANIRTAAEMRTGPRNLLRAFRLLPVVQKQRAAEFGNIGCGRTFIEIDGAEVDARHYAEYLDVDLSNSITAAEFRREFGPDVKRETRIGFCRRVLTARGSIPA